jgi:peroxiredoxin
MNALLALLLLLVQVQGVAPNVTAFSIQGTTVNLDFYKGKQNVLLVFYRTQN